VAGAWEWSLPEESNNDRRVWLAVSAKLRPNHGPSPQSVSARLSMDLLGRHVTDRAEHLSGNCRLPECKGFTLSANQTSTPEAGLWRLLPRSALGAEIRNAAPPQVRPAFLLPISTLPRFSRRAPLAATTRVVAHLGTAPAESPWLVPATTHVDCASAISMR
jgi:hypothetical protein